MAKKYLSIKLVGHSSIRAYPNPDKTDEKQPDYKGDGIGVWVNEIQDNDKMEA